MRLSEHLYEASEDVAQVFNSLVERSSTLQEFLFTGAKKVVYLRGLACDIFVLLYAHQPKRYPQDDRRYYTRVHEQFCDLIMAAPDFGRLHQLSLGNKLGAGMATLFFLEEILKHLEPECISLSTSLYKNETRWRRSSLELKAAEKVMKILNSLGQCALALAYSKKMQYIEWKNQKLESKVQASLQAWEEYLTKCSSHLQGRVYHAYTKAVHYVEKSSNLLVGWQGPNQDWRRGDYNQANFLDYMLKARKLIKILERLDTLKGAKNCWSFTGDNRDEGLVEFGNDLNRVVPEDMALLTPFSLLFKYRLVEQQLQLYHDTVVQKPGPVVICIDCSGSMQGPKEEIAKAFTLGIVEICRNRQRDVTVILFGGVTEEIRMLEIPEGQITLEQATEISESQLASAGTDFVKPLSKAVDFVAKSGYAESDILFITDGCACISSDFIQQYTLWKNQLNFRTTSVLINYGQTSVDEVKKFSDEVMVSSDYLGYDVASSLLARFV